MRYSVRGQWRGPTAGGCQDFDTWHLNPQFHLKAVGPDARVPIHVFVTLTQVCFLSFLQVITFVEYVDCVFHDCSQINCILEYLLTILGY